MEGLHVAPRASFLLIESLKRELDVGLSTHRVSSCKFIPFETAQSGALPGIRDLCLAMHKIKLYQFWGFGYKVWAQSCQKSAVTSPGL